MTLLIERQQITVIMRLLFQTHSQQAYYKYVGRGVESRYLLTFNNKCRECPSRVESREVRGRWWPRDRAHFVCVVVVSIA